MSDRWEGNGINEVAKEKDSGIIRVRVNQKYFRPSEVVSALSYVDNRDHTIGLHMIPVPNKKHFLPLFAVSRSSVIELHIQTVRVRINTFENPILRPIVWTLLNRFEEYLSFFECSINFMPQLLIRTDCSKESQKSF